MNENITLPLISLFIIISLLLIITIGCFISYGNLQFTPSDSSSLLCPLTQCATNISDGSKRCPQNGKQIKYDPASEVCSLPQSCSNNLLPYALNTDGSVNLNGQCENYICPCTNKVSCAFYVSSLFNTSNGNVYEPVQFQRITFPQSQISNSQSLTSVNNQNTTFCSINPSWLALSSPGCNFLDTVNVTYNDVVTCMNSINTSNGNGFVYSPCSQGILAYITNDSSKITSISDTVNLPVSCINGSQCTNPNEGTFYDRTKGSIVCLSLSQ